MRVHELKTDAAPFDAVRNGRKRFEIRRDDRGYQVGDILVLCRQAPLPTLDPFEAAVELVRVTYILRDGRYGLKDGYVAMGIERVRLVAGEE